MTKKIISALALILSLTSCKPAEKEVKEPIKKVEIEASKKSDQKQDKKEAKEEDEKDTEDKKISKTEENANQNNEIFSQLQGKEFSYYLTNGSERIFFYEDGRFDGAWWSGDGMSMLANLYTGKFSDPKKNRR